MAVKFWPLGLILFLVVVVIIGFRYRMRLRPPAANAQSRWLAFSDRLRRLPRFQELMGSRVNWLRVEIFSLVLALMGSCLLAARLVAVDADSLEMRSRDIMLCLDVSGSMNDVDADVIDGYQQIAEQLRGERIGMVIWDSTAVTVFPLTDDYDFIVEQLTSMRHQLLTGGSLITAVRFGDGSSLIGDGLISCLQRFDQKENDRPRTLVFATDNELAGMPFFTLSEATEYAKKTDVMVYSIAPYDIKDRERAGLAELVEKTGGDMLQLPRGDVLNVERLIKAIVRQQRKAIMGAPRARSFDLTWPGASLFALGLAGMLLAGWRRP